MRIAWASCYAVAMAVIYKFAEVAPVTDEELERTVNRYAAEGWQLDGIHFVMREASHRPAMAFVAFIRSVRDGEGQGDGEAGAAG